MVKKSYGDQTVSSSSVADSPGKYLVEIEGLSREQLEDFIAQIEAKLLPTAGDEKPTLEGWVKKLKGLAAADGDPPAFALELPVAKLGGLETTIRDELSSQTTVQYREFYVELSAEIARARGRYIRGELGRA